MMRHPQPSAIRRRVRFLVGATAVGIVFTSGGAPAGAMWSLPTGLHAALVRATVPRSVLPVAPAHPGAPDEYLARLDPGIASVETVFTARLTVPAPAVNTAALSSLQSSLADQIGNGQVGTDQSSAQQALVNAIDASPLSYLTPSSDVVSVTAQTLGVGTAWEIAPGGWLVIPSELVRPSRSFLNGPSELVALNALDNQNTSALASAAGPSLSKAAFTTLAHAISEYDAHYLSVGAVTARITVQWGRPLIGLRDGLHGHIAHVVKTIPAPTRVPGVAHGISVLHVDGIGGMPTVPLASPLADSGKLSIPAGQHSGSSDTVVVGYPFAAELGDGSVPGANLTPSAAVTTAHYRRSLLSISSPLLPASVGSAVVSRAGDVIGMVVATGAGPFTDGSSAHSTALKSGNIATLLSRAGIRAESGTADSLYRDGFDAWFAHHYSAALPDFEQIGVVAPKDPYAALYAAAARRQIAEGHDMTPMSPWTILLIVLVTAIALRLVIFPLVRYVRHGTHHRRRPEHWARHGAGFRRTSRGERAFPVGGLRPNEEDWEQAIRDELASSRQR